MMAKNTKYLLLFLFLLSWNNLMIAAPLTNQRYERSRLFWDPDTKQLLTRGSYVRLRELNNGDWLVVASEAGDIISVRSTDQGKTWQRAQHIIHFKPGYSLTNAEALQLQDGTIILGWNERVRDKSNEALKYSICCAISEDNGETWSEPIYIYTANHDFGDGCWEPAFLQLPNGDVQVYFANEGPYTQSHEQEISMATSKDGGKTWSNAAKISFRANFRDGMPVPLMLDDGQTIAVAIEDNGTGNKRFRSAIVRTTLEDCWRSGFVDGTSPNRNMAYTEEVYPSRCNAGAPYIAKLLTGEIILSFQGDGNGRVKWEDMFACVGSADARDFVGMTQPFRTDTAYDCHWNSLSVLRNGKVIALGEARGNIFLVQADALNAFTCTQAGAPVQPVVLGNEVDSRWTVHFVHAKNKLIMRADVRESGMSDQDGIRLMMDNKGQTAVYFFGANGTAPKGCSSTIIPTDKGYTLQARIPYRLTKDIYIAVERDRLVDGITQTDGIIDAKADDPKTWIKFNIQ